MKTRLYHIVAINVLHGWSVRCTKYPMTHKECCTMMRKMSQHPCRRLQLEEVICKS